MLPVTVVDPVNLAPCTSGTRSPVCFCAAPPVSQRESSGFSHARSTCCQTVYCPGLSISSAMRRIGSNGSSNRIGIGFIRRVDLVQVGEHPKPCPIQVVSEAPRRRPLVDRSLLGLDHPCSNYALAYASPSARLAPVPIAAPHPFRAGLVDYRITSSQGRRLPFVVKPLGFDRLVKGA